MTEIEFLKEQHAFMLANMGKEGLYESVDATLTEYARKLHPELSDELVNDLVGDWWLEIADMDGGPDEICSTWRKSIDQEIERKG